MLLWLAQNFQQDFSFLRVFNFLTFRAVFATLTALAIGLIAGPGVIRMLARLKVGQAVRTDGPQTHLIKTDFDCRTVRRIRAHHFRNTGQNDLQALRQISIRRFDCARRNIG